MKKIRCLLVTAFLVAAARSNAQFPFVQGDFYSSADDSDLITQFTPSGAVVGSLAVPGASSVRGIGFGPDGLIYADTADPDLFWPE